MLHFESTMYVVGSQHTSRYMLFKTVITVISAEITVIITVRTVT